MMDMSQGLSAFFATSAHPYIEFDTSGTITHANSAAEPWRSVLQEDLAEWVARITEEGFQTTREVWLDDRCFIQTFAAAESGISAVAFEITEAKSAEWVATIPEMDPNPIIEVDDQGQVTYANSRAHSLFPTLSDLGPQHPLFEGVKFRRCEGHDRAYSLHEVEIGGRWYLVSVNQVPEYGVFRSTAIDISDQKLRQEETDDNLIEVLYRLANTTEAREDTTGTHLLRVSEYCAILGRQLGLGGRNIQLLRRAAALHDIGKIAIPQEILLKPERLTFEELEIVKTHSTIGARLLEGSGSEVLVMAHDIALSHHERWDGRGYPLGLSGEEIPLVGRICAVADVFDALTTQRPYKAAWTIEEATDKIYSGTGTQFDPQVVDAFRDSLEELLATRELLLRPQSGGHSRKIA
jgi:PAS domain-containing protein